MAKDIQVSAKVNFIIISIFLAMLLSCNQANIAEKKESKIMDVKVVSLEKCNATPLTIALVKDVAKEMNININFTHAVVKTQDDANKHRHIGSPTVQINGLDIDPGARDIEQFGVT